ncbi:MAG: dockerin type I domain-containing protein [Planctomycetota bacterium]
MNRSTLLLAACSTLVVCQILSAQIVIPQRFVQIRSVDFTTSVLELHNFGTASRSLNGWRFCSHDENQDRRYSAAAGLNGITLASGDSLFIHFNNDAVNANEINISTIGGNFAGPLDTSDAYAIQIYYNSGFGSGNNIADHIQWSLSGTDNIRADERSDEAEQGGVWEDQSQWISVQADSQRINLFDAAAQSELHSPANYETINPNAVLLGDVNCDGSVDLLDVSPFVDLISNNGFDAKADMNEDGAVNLIDVQPFVQLLSGG